MVRLILPSWLRWHIGKCVPQRQRCAKLCVTESRLCPLRSSPPQNAPFRRKHTPGNQRNIKRAGGADDLGSSGLHCASRSRRRNGARARAAPPAVVSLIAIVAELMLDIRGEGRRKAREAGPFVENTRPEIKEISN